MKVAIVCDWLVTLAGAEKLLGEMFKCFPQADLFSVIDFLKEDQRDFVLHKKAQTTFIQRLPFAHQKYRSYLPLMPLAIEQLDLSDYDIVLSSSHAVAKGVITGPNQLHISYVHSPMRYAWDLQHEYLRETRLDKKPQGWLARYFLHKLRLWDRASAQGVDHFLANSNFIAQRIQKAYRREATVIYPVVDTSRFTPYAQKEDFYFTASRLVPYKRIDLIVESFAQLPDKKLIVIGDGPEMQKIRAKAGANVYLLGYQPDDVLISHMQRAKAFIFAAEEDFGLVPLEAQACGTPVIALGKGGALETVRDPQQKHPTGLFFNSQTTEAICEAIKIFEQGAHQFTVEACTAQAARFSPEIFQTRFKTFVEEKFNQHHASP